MQKLLSLQKVFSILLADLLGYKFSANGVFMYTSKEASRILKQYDEN